MSLRAIVLLAALVHATPALAGLFPANDKAKALLDQGLALEAEGKGTEAFARFRESAQADPTASMPVSHIAHMFYVASRNAPADDAAALRKRAGDTANMALQLDDRDPLAMEILRLLADDKPQPRHQPGAAALKAVAEGEVLFNDKKFAAAAEKYAQAVQLDPAYAEAVLLLGDCAFMQNDLAGAEVLFRKTVQIDPLYGVAWRFLFDAQLRQGKFKDAEASAIGAIAAMPSERQAWMRIDMLQEKWGQRLTPFRLVPKARIDGNTIKMDGDIPASDSAAWMAYGMAMTSASEKLAKASPFERDLDAWKTTLQILVEMGKTDQLKDDGLRAMLRFHKAGQLKAAVFLLLYREAYRPDFEAWKLANPGAIKGFIDTFQVGL